jgi:hypothetical protein
MIYYMEKEAIKDILYGGLTELMNNQDFYYRSTAGSDYSKWTEKGSAVMLEYVTSMSRQIHTAEDKLLDKRAKNLVIKGLKGETV